MADDRETAAILLMLLAEEEAASIVSQLEPGEIERLGSAMFALGEVDEARVAGALDSFVSGARGRTNVTSQVGGHVSGVVTRALGGARAPAMLGRIVPETHTDLLPTLKWLSLDDLKHLAQAEHPQLVALLVAHLQPAVAASVVASLPDADQADLLYRAATLGPISAQAFAEAEALLADSIGIATQGGRAGGGGAPAIAAILNHAPKALEQRMLRALTKRDRALAQRIEDNMVVFDDILSLSDKDLGAVCRGAEPADLALAMKGMDEAACGRIFATMSSRAADTMRDAIAEQGPAKLAEVQAAQRSIITQAKTLADAGTIQLGQGAEDYV